MTAAPLPDDATVARAPWPRPRDLVLLALAAVLLRLILLLGRGDYVAFDEGWYLLLARSLYTGDGYSLIGVPHTALSPLFPLLAGAGGVLLDSWLWGGRIVAAVASGLVVVPAWAVFRRLAPPRTAFIATVLVAVLPSLAPFVVAFWIGADLWVGAEPLLHLLLYSGVALWLRADEGEGFGRWLLPGAAFGLAFLARPEAILTWGFLGLAALVIAVRNRSPRRLAGAALMGLGFLVMAAPYWVYIHDVSGEWALTGRGINAVSTAARLTTGGSGGDASGTIERMLWRDEDDYAERLYALQPNGLRLRSGYWGMQPPLTPAESALAATTMPPEPSPPASPAAEGGRNASREAEPGDASMRSPLGLMARALGMIFPLLLWPFVILGLAQPRGRAVLRRELPVALSLLGTSLAIALLVAVDPRTQLFLVPLLASYAARGFSLIEDQVQQHAQGSGVRRGLVELMLAGIAVVWLLGINGQRLYRSLVLGSPHHIVADQNREVAGEIDTLLDDGAGPVMSWHPAIAVFADRDWRVLPFADLPGIIRYAGASGAGAIVLSAYYPPDLGVESAGIRYLLMSVPPDAARVDRWMLRIEPVDSIRGVGRLQPADGD